MWSRLTYTFRETAASLSRNITLTVAAILTSAVSLFLVGGTFLVQRGFDNLLSKWAGGVQMIVYVKADATPDQIENVESALKQNSGVIDTEKLVYFDKDASLAEAKRLFAADPGAFALLTRDNIPTEFKVVPRQGQLDILVQLANSFRTEIPAVQKVVLAQDQIEQISKLRDFVQTVTVGLSILLLIGALILLADEPTGNLDPGTGEGIMRLLDRINKTGTTVVMATHDQRIVNMMRKRVIQMDRGIIVRDQARGVYE